MKKLNTLMMALAAAAMTFTACSDAEDIMPNESNNGKGVTIIAENPDVENDTRTSMTYEGNTIVPKWRYFDNMFMFGTGSKYKVLFGQIMSQHEDYKKIVEFREAKENDFDTSFKNSEKVYAIYSEANKDSESFWNSVENDVVTITNYVNNNFIIYDEDIKNGNMILNNDILISESMNPKDVLETKMKPRFKRYTAVIRVNIKDETTDKVVDSNDYKSFQISNNKDYFWADVKFNMQTEEISKITDNYNESKAISPNTNGENIKYGKTFYMTSLPVSLQQEDNITFTVETANGYTFVKEVTLGAEGLNIESGKITTLNVSLNDDDITVTPILDPKPDPAIDPTYTLGSGIINMKNGHYGRLTGKMLAEAMTADAKIKVKGNINAFDINSILKLQRDASLTNLDNFTIDLSEADIIGGDNSACIGSMGFKHRIFQNNIVPGNFFYKVDGMDNKTIKRLLLPNSAFKIQGYAFDLGANIDEIVVGKGTTQIYSNAIQLINGRPLKLFILAGPEMSNGIENYPVNNTENLEIYVHSSWKDTPQDPTKISGWKGMYPKVKGFCDDNCNIVQ